MKGIALVLFTVFFAIVGILFNSYVLSVFWGWFVMPLFDVPSITSLQAYGLMLIASLLKGYTPQKSENKSTAEALGTLVAMATVTPAIGLLVGYIVHLFM